MATARSLLPALRSSAGRYVDVLRTPGAAAFFLPAALARLGIAMTGLGLLFSLQAATGSFATAGAATATFAVAEAVVGPQVARAVDRWGQTATVPGVAALHVAAVAAAIGSAGHVATGVTLGAVAIAGAAVPQPGALSAARWSALVTDEPRLRTAFSLEAAVNDVVFLSGPLLVTAASTLLPAWSGSAVAAALVAVGCGTLALRRATAPAPHPVRPSRPRPGRAWRTGRRVHSSLVAVPFIATCGVNLGLGCFFGAVPLLVTATATADGVRPVTGAVLALSSGASIVAGLLYGSLRSAPPPHVVQVTATGVLVVAVLIGALRPTLSGLALMLVVGGATIAPLVASSSEIVRRSVDVSERTQGFTWVGSASAAGIALGAAATGATIAGSGVEHAVVVLLLLVLATAGCAVVAGRVLARPRRERDGRPGPAARP